MTKILVTGDSFAAGEWSREDYTQKVTHGGLAEYLSQDGYDVKHLPFPGNSNFFVHDLIKYLIFFFRYKNQSLNRRDEIIYIHQIFYLQQH